MSLRDTLNDEKWLCKTGFHTRHVILGIRIPAYEQRTKELIRAVNTVWRLWEKISRPCYALGVIHGVIESNSYYQHLSIEPGSETILPMAGRSTASRRCAVPPAGCPHGVQPVWA